MRIAVIFVGLTVSVLACGGASSTLSGGDGGSADSGGSSGGSGGSSGGGSGSGGSSGAGSGGSSGSGSGGSGSSSGGSGSSSGGSGSSSGGTVSTVACGSSTCSAPAQTCCVTASGGNPPMYSYACANGSACPGGGMGGGMGAVGLQCTATADCPSPEVCCLSNMTNVAVCGTQCNNGTQLCDPAATPTGCPQGTMCITGGIDGLPMSFGSCQ